MHTSTRRLPGARTLTSGQRLKVVVGLTLTALVAGLFGFEPANLGPTPTRSRGFAALAMNSEAAGVAHSSVADVNPGASANPATVAAELNQATRHPVAARGTLSGAVYSDIGKSLAGRTVELTHRYKQLTYTTTTNAQGLYSLPFVESPADYLLIVLGGADHKDFRQELRLTEPAAGAELNIFLESYE